MTEGLPTVDVSLLTYNTMLLPLVDYEQSTRAALIPDQIHASGNYDVICINEGFDSPARETLKQGLIAHGYTHITEVVGDTPLVDANGGVFVASRHPLDRVETAVYPQASGLDAIAKKGVQLVRLRKNGLPIYLAVTHLQANRGSTERNIRQSQLSMLSAKLNDFVADAREEGALVLIAGDLNICAINDVDEASDAFATLRANLVAQRPDGQFTSDTQNNTVAHYRYPTEPKEWLDYILLCDRGVPVEKATIEVVKPQADYTMGGHAMRDLSDHYALSAEMTVRTDLAQGPNPEDDEDLI